jgi:signal transduction histidine kinase
VFSVTTILLLIGYLPLRLHWYALATTPGTTLPAAAVVPSLNTLSRLIADLFGVAFVLGFATLGALIVSRARAHARRIGWLYCLIALVGAVDSCSALYAIEALLAAPGSLPAGLVFAWIQTWTWLVVAGLLFVFLPLLYPTGRSLSRRWRLVAVSAIILFGGGTVLAAIEPGRLGNHLLEFPISIANPLGVAALGPALGVIVSIVLPLLLLLILLSAASLLLRLRRARGEEREQLKWFAYVAVLLVAQFLIINFLSFFPGQAVTLVVQGAIYLATPFIAALLPILTGLAILRYRLFDIDLIINRTLVYSALSACVIGLYVLVVGGLGALLQTQGSLPLSILATGLVALLFQPLRAWLQRGVNRLMYGERDEPYTLLARLGSLLDATLAPDAIFPTIVQTVRDALHLPYVAIARRQGEAFAEAFVVAAAAGKPVDDTLYLPLTYQGRVVGKFLLGARAPGETFSLADRRLLDGLARQVGVALHAAQLTADLQRARARLVMVGEEERRRLRRDLHDGLGPALAAQSLKLEAARDLALTSPEQAVALLSALLEESQRAITDIRRLVYALRPPELDELGLIGALRGQVARSAHPRLAISLDAPASLPPLAAAVEVAAYRIAQEGLTNVVRHAAASSCFIQLAITGVGGLCLEIVDNGHGLPTGRPVGVGLLSMRERAEELGGECVIEPAPGGGTRVSVRLPCGIDGWDQPGEEESHDRSGDQSYSHRR